MSKSLLHGCLGWWQLSKSFLLHKNKIFYWNMKSIRVLIWEFPLRDGWEKCWGMPFFNGDAPESASVLIWIGELD
jgi:hypothetical protein